MEIDGDPWFVAVDVCRALGFKLGYDGAYNHTRRLDAEERQTIDPRNFDTGANGVRLSVISESGLYKLIMRSDKPQAKAFQDWVTKTVLPAIRKDGGYVMGGLVKL